MTFCNHSLNQTWIGSCDVDFSFAVVVACDEERGMETCFIQNVEQLRGVLFGVLSISILLIFRSFFSF